MEKILEIKGKMQTTNKFAKNLKGKNVTSNE
jgi:hypothetical protein